MRTASGPRLRLGTRDTLCRWQDLGVWAGRRRVSGATKKQPIPPEPQATAVPTPEHRWLPRPCTTRSRLCRPLPAARPPECIDRSNCHERSTLPGVWNRGSGVGSQEQGVRSRVPSGTGRHRCRESPGVAGSQVPGPSIKAALLPAAPEWARRYRGRGWLTFTGRSSLATSFGVY